MINRFTSAKNRRITRLLIFGLILFVFVFVVYRVAGGKHVRGIDKHVAMCEPELNKSVDFGLEKTGKSSMHRCVGGGSKGVGSQDYFAPTKGHQFKSCEFTNICYEKRSKKFVYFSSTDKSKRVPFDFQTDQPCNKHIFGEANDVLATPLVGVNARSLIIDMKTWIGKHQSTAMDIKQVVGDIPKHAKWMTEDYLVLKRWGGANWGHILLQSVVPSFILMEYFGVHDEWIKKDMNFVFLDDCFDEDDVMVAFPGGNKYRKLCEKFSQTTFGLMSARTPKTISQVEPEEELVCFPRLMAGTEAFSLMDGSVTNDGGIGAFFNRFKEFIFKKNGFENERKDVDRIKITICGKGKVSFNSRGIGNVFEIVAHFKRIYKGKKVEVIHMEVESTPLLEQAEIVSTTDVLIGPGGATGMSSLFLPDGSSVIVVPLCAKGTCPVPDKSVCVCNGGFCCYQFDNYFYNYVKSNVIVFPVEIPQDISSGCTCEAGKCSNCNVNLNLQKLEGLVARCFEYAVQYRKHHRFWRNLY